MCPNRIGVCVTGHQNAGSVEAESGLSLTSPTTPTTVIHCGFCVLRKWSRLPTALWSARYFLAMAALMITT